MNKLTIVAASIISALSLSACSSSQQPAETAAPSSSTAAVEASTDAEEESVSVEETSEKRVLHVGTEGNMFPWTYTEDNKVVGFEADILNEIGERLGYEIDMQTIKWSGLFGSLDSGRLDTVANIVTINPEREEKYYFTKPYVYNPMVLATNGDSDINSMDDIDGRSVVVEAGSSDEQAMDALEAKMGITLERVYYEGISIKDVELGRVDLWIGGEPNLKTNIANGINMKIVGPTDEVQEYGYPFPKTEEGKALCEEFDQVLDEMHEDGTLTEISERHFGMDVTKPIAE